VQGSVAALVALVAAPVERQRRGGALELGMRMERPKKNRAARSMPAHSSNFGDKPKCDRALEHRFDPAIFARHIQRKMDYNNGTCHVGVRSIENVRIIVLPSSHACRNPAIFLYHTADWPCFVHLPGSVHKGATGDNRRRGNGRQQATRHLWV